MSLGRMISSYRDSAGGNKQVAPTLQERWPASPRPELSTIESRLSELVAEKPKGVRFFFDDRAVAALLLEVLGVPDEQREALIEEARGLAEGVRPVQLVIDVSAIDIDDRDEADLLFEAVEALVIEALEPVALVITEPQYRWLPRSVEPPRFTLHRVPSPAAGAAKASELAARRGLLLSPDRSGLPAERWAAVRWSDNTLELYPEEALATFARQGRLPTPPAPEHDLRALGFEPDDGVRLPDDPLARRKLMDDLPDPAQASELGTPARRLGLATLLGVGAASTERERVEAELATLARALGLSAESASQEALDALLSRATRRPIGPCLLRVGDVLHAVNAPNAVPSARLVVHAITTRPPILPRLQQAIAGRTRDDWREDRLLQTALAPDSADAAAFAFARAGLLHGGVEVNEASPDPGWLEGLRALVTGDPPAAALLVKPGKTNATNERLFVTTAAEVRSMGASDTDRGLRQVPPAVPERLIRRGEDPLLVTVRRDGRPSHEHPLIPMDRDTLANPNRWLDLMEEEDQAAQLPDSVGYYESYRNTKRGRRKDILERGGAAFAPDSVWKAWSGHRVGISGDTWSEADLHLAFAWRALTRALAEPEVIQLHDATGLLSLGSGLFVEVRARRHGAASAPLTAALEVSLHHEEPGPLTSPVVTHIAKTGSYRTEVGYSLPKLYLSGRGWAMDLRFVASPLFMNDILRGAQVTASASAAAATVAEEDRRRRDDD